MNAKTLSATMILSLAALSSAHAADAPRADRIVDLPAIHVHPTAEQLAERAAIVAAERAQALTAQLAARLVAQATMSAHLR